MIHILLTFFIPESPYFFIYKNEDENAKVSMTKLRDGNDVDIVDELNVIKVLKNAFLSSLIIEI